MGPAPRPSSHAHVPAATGTGVSPSSLPQLSRHPCGLHLHPMPEVSQGRTDWSEMALAGSGGPHLSFIPVLRRPRQEDGHKFKVSLGYTVEYPSSKTSPSNLLSENYLIVYSWILLE